jgi:hypothetical protein
MGSASWPGDEGRLKLKGMAEAQATVRGNEGSQCRDETVPTPAADSWGCDGIPNMLHSGRPNKQQHHQRNQRWTAGADSEMRSSLTMLCWVLSLMRHEVKEQAGL